MTTNLTPLLDITQILAHNATGSPTVHELLPADLVAVTLMSIVTLVAFQANLWIVVVVLATPQLRSTMANIFVINLCCVDLLASGVTLPLSIAIFVKGADSVHDTMCDVTGFFGVCVMVTSVLSLCVISIERYYTIAFPMHHAGHATPCAYLLAVGAVWGVSFLVASLPLVGVNTYRFKLSRRSCSFNWQGGDTAGTFFILLLFLLSFFIPSIVLLGMYSGIFKVAKRAATVVAPMAKNVRSSPVGSLKNSSITHEAVFTIMGKGVAYDSAAPKINVMEVSNDSTSNDTNLFPRRLSVEDSGIRTADYTDTVSAKSLFIDNNNDRLQGLVQRLKVYSRQESRPAWQDADTSSSLKCHSETDNRLSANSNASSLPVPVILKSGDFEKSSQSAQVLPNVGRVKGSHMKAFKTLMIIVMAYLFQWGPYFACLLHELGCEGDSPEPLKLAVVWLSHSSYAVNPVLYGCMNRQIREELLQLLHSLWRCCCCCCFECQGRKQAKGVVSSCIAAPCQRNTEKSVHGKHAALPDDDLAMENESFFQFLQRTKASEESLPAAVSRKESSGVTAEADET